MISVYRCIICSIIYLKWKNLGLSSTNPQVSKTSNYDNNMVVMNRWTTAKLLPAGASWNPVGCSWCFQSLEEFVRTFPRKVSKCFFFPFILTFWTILMFFEQVYLSILYLMVILFFTPQSNSATFFLLRSSIGQGPATTPLRPSYWCLTSPWCSLWPWRWRRSNGPFVEAPGAPLIPVGRDTKPSTHRTTSCELWGFWHLKNTHLVWSCWILQKPLLAWSFVTMNHDPIWSSRCLLYCLDYISVYVGIVDV